MLWRAGARGIGRTTWRKLHQLGVFRDKKSQAEKRADGAHVPVPAEEVARAATKVSNGLAEKEK